MGGARTEFFSLFTVPKDAGHFTKCFYLLLNIALTPLLLIGRSIYIFILPCFGSFLKSMCLKCVQACGCVKMCWKPFVDPEFPPNRKSLGNNDPHKWYRLSQMKVPHRSGRIAPADCLFNDSISASDVAQGAMGDCWLMAAIATLCERPALISNCFITRTFNPFGRYKIRLYDTSKNKFVILTIDDHVPVDPTTLKPIYSHLMSNEIWPLLLEKAYAKLKGSYQSLSGGLPLDAMRTLTGYSGEHLILSGDKKTKEATFKKLQYYFNSGCLIAAGSKGQDKTRTEGRDKVEGSIVGGHAYSVLAIKSPMLTTDTVHLLKLRNPW